MRQGTLNCGLSYYQEEQWLSALKRHGYNIMDKSLLSTEQKEILFNEHRERNKVVIEPGFVRAIDGKTYYNEMRIIAK